MQAATAMVKEKTPASPTRAHQWWEFHRALAERNFVRAVVLARALGLAAERVKSLQHDAIRQFLVEYRNFQGASRLLADYGFTPDELQALVEELLRRKELTTERTFAWQAGKPTTLSVAEQIRNFARTQLKTSRRRKRRKVGGWWNNLKALGRSVTEQLIEEVNRQAVSSVNEFNAALQKAGKNNVLLRVRRGNQGAFFIVVRPHE